LFAVVAKPASATGTRLQHAAVLTKQKPACATSKRSIDSGFVTNDSRKQSAKESRPVKKPDEPSVLAQRPVLGGTTASNTNIQVFA
jgi:hypothetical protein